VELEPLLDDQESDSRATTGAVYWEGAVRALTDGKLVGQGYLELTGYGEPLRLPGDDPGT
jgi:predicted secreted hydrolase